MAYRWATYCLLLTICSFVTVTRAAGLRIKVEERQVQSSAQCNSGYEWAFSGNNDSPCLAAEKVHMVCEGSAHTLEQLLPEHHYNRPSKSTASECSCSWAAYNLLMACTACQGQPNSIQRWPYWSRDCGPFASNAMSLRFSKVADLSPWAQANPAQWIGGMFSEDQAQGFVQNELPGSKRTASMGAITGGVVAACAVIFLAVSVFWYLRQKKLLWGRA